MCICFKRDKKILKAQHLKVLWWKASQTADFFSDKFLHFHSENLIGLSSLWFYLLGTLLYLFENNSYYSCLAF